MEVKINEGYIYLEDLNLAEDLFIKTARKNSDNLFVIKDFSPKKYKTVFYSPLFEQLSEIMVRNKESFSLWGIGEFAAIEKEETKLSALKLFDHYQKRKTEQLTSCVHEVIEGIYPLLEKAISTPLSVCFDFEHLEG